MSKTARHREIRQLAMQLLYQLGIQPEELAPTPAALLEMIDPEDEENALAFEDAAQEAVELALAAWAMHEKADDALTELTPDWPTRRQPPVDRAILRLAYYEIVTERVHLKIAINEAVELAKAFGSEQSPSFINGVLDRLARQRDNQSPEQPSTGDAWLDDAVQGESSA